MGKRIRFLLAVFVLGIGVTGWGQGVYEAWVARYNGLGLTDEGRILTLDSAGNVYVSGLSDDGESSWDLVTIKYSTGGQVLWVSRIDMAGYPFDAVLDKDMNYIVIGTGPVYGTGSDFFTMKYNALGETLWVRTYTNTPWTDPDVATGVAVDESGYVYVAGTTQTNGPGGGTTVKYSSNGDLIWARTHGIWATDVEVSQDGYIYVSGAGFGGYTIIKYSSNGDSIWSTVYPHTWFNGPSDRIPFIKLDNYGNIFLVGFTGSECLMVKYNPFGDTLWSRTYPCSTVQSQVDVNGNLYVVGHGPILKYSPNGDLEWARIPELGPDFIGFSVAIDSGGFVTVAGSLDGRYLVIKYSPEGNVVWQHLREDQGTAWSVAVDDNQTIYASGTSWDYVNKTGFLTVKYISTFDIPPALDHIGSKSIFEGETLSFQIHAADPDTGILILSAINAPVNSVFVDSGNGAGAFTFYPDTTQAGLLHVTFLVSDLVLTDSEMVELTVINCNGITGDANNTHSTTLADIVALVNYLFSKPGFPSCPSNSEVCWLSDLLCRGDWNGNGVVTLSDVIYGVNYIFNKPGGPWVPLPSGACCLPVP